MTSPDRRNLPLHSFHLPSRADFLIRFNGLWTSPARVSARQCDDYYSDKKLPAVEVIRVERAGDLIQSCLKISWHAVGYMTLQETDTRTLCLPLPSDNLVGNDAPGQGTSAQANGEPCLVSNAQQHA